MKGREIQKLAPSFLPEYYASFQFKGNIFLKYCGNGLLHGIEFQPSSYSKDIFYMNLFVQLLYDVNGYFAYDFSERVRDSQNRQSWSRHEIDVEDLRESMIRWSKFHQDLDTLEKVSSAYALESINPLNIVRVMPRALTRIMIGKPEGYKELSAIVSSSDTTWRDFEVALHEKATKYLSLITPTDYTRLRVVLDAEIQKGIENLRLQKIIDGPKVRPAKGGRQASARELPGAGLTKG